MRKAQVRLRDDQKTDLERLSHSTGRKQSELIRHGVDLAIAEAREVAVADDGKSENWKQAWLGIVGLWADRDDVDERRAQLRADDQRRDAERQRQWRGK